MRLAAATHMMNSRDSSPAMAGDEAPKTLRMPISLIRRSAEKAARPNSPRQPTPTARRLKKKNIRMARSSLL